MKQRFNRIRDVVMERFWRSTYVLQHTLEGYNQFKGYRQDKTVQDLYRNLWSLENSMRDFKIHKELIIKEMINFENFIHADLQAQQKKVKEFEEKALENNLLSEKEGQ